MGEIREEVRAAYDEIYGSEPSAQKDACMGDVAKKLRTMAQNDVLETGRDMTFEYNDAVLWAAAMEEGAAAIEARDSRIAALEAENTWQPIETAPKDGTKILVITQSVGGTHMAVTSWPENWGGKWPTAYMHYANGVEPTHWRPLPTPPKGADQ